MDAGKGSEVGDLIRWLRWRQRLSRPQLSDRVVRLSGDHAMNPDRLRGWETGAHVPEGYWRGLLATALGIRSDSLDRAATVTVDYRRRQQR